MAWGTVWTERTAEVKKHRYKLVIYIIIAVVLYVVILAAGVSILCNSSMNSQANDVFLSDIEVTSVESAASEILELVGDNEGHLQIFSSDDQLIIDTYNSDESSVADYPYSCEKYLNLIDGSQAIRRFTLTYDSNHETYRLVYVYGVPVICDGHFVAKAFNIESPLYFSKTIKTFVAFLSAAYLVMAASIIIVLVMREKFMLTRATYIDNVTHSLKTPVTAIKALAETLVDDMEPDPEEQKINLRLILQQADVQSEMVQNMLNLSRIQTGRVTIKKRKIIPKEILSDPIKKHTMQCRKKNINLCTGENFASIDYFYADPNAARQILDILLDNAIKFTPEGGSITIDALKKGHKAVISVADTGIGISKEKVGNIFDRFYTTGAGNSDGSGLGLSIASEMARKMKEKIWVESEKGHGTTMYFTLSV